MIYLADPPWRYSFSKSKSRKVENQYPTMSPEEIRDLDFPFEDNSVLYLWATAPKLELALEVMSAWGFKYKTHMVWDKGKIGMGYWCRGRHELVLIGVKGKHSPPPPDHRHPSVFCLPRGQHSEKPSHWHSIIEAAFPDEEKVELFARKQRPGWTCLGLDLGVKL